ncbi:hypothetical protein GS538_09265 [Rhodococcus hoagii]|nr:hypothetical protein [Prescottella equi]
MSYTAPDHDLNGRVNIPLLFGARRAGEGFVIAMLAFLMLGMTLDATIGRTVASILCGTLGIISGICAAACLVIMRKA